jgi:membrane fusion protein
MTSSLFRAEALEFQKQYREFGQVAHLRPISQKILAWLLSVAVISLIIFCCLAGYTRKETVRGYLSPSKGTAEIYAPQMGTVTDLYVSEDQLVTQGDVLFTIDMPQVSAEGVDVNQAVLKGLLIQKMLLTSQIYAEERSTRAEKDRLMQAVASGQTELAQLSSQMEFETQQIIIAQKLVDSAAKIHASGYLSDPEFYKRQEELLDAKRDLSALRQRYSARETELAQTRNSLEQLPTESARRLQPLRSEVAQIDQRVAEVSGRRSIAVRAPISGRIANLQATVGQIADPKRLQAEILPSDSRLMATLFVPTRAIGFIKSGQIVRLLYDAFPFQHFGTYSGQVTSVSKTILSDSGVGAPFQLNEPAYKVVAALERQDIDANGGKVPLQAGMLLQADILIEKRTLIGWLLDPLFDVRM